MKLTYRQTKYAAYIGYMTQAIINNLLPLLFVSFQRDFSLSLDKISLLITMNFGVQILTDIAAAKFSDRIGYRCMTVGAHIIAAAGLCALSVLPFVIDPFMGLCICSAVMAVGGGLIEVIISPVVEALPGDEKVSAMGMLHSFYCWGQVLVVLLSTVYFTVIGVSGWRFLPLLWAVIPLFNTFLFANVPLRTLDEEEESMPLKELFKVKIFWLFTVLMICSGASELAMSQWASLFAEEGLNVSKTVGDLLGPCAFALLMGISRVIFSRYGEKIELGKAIAASGVLCVVSYMTAVFAPLPIISLIGCAVCGLSVGIMWPGTFSLASKHYSRGGTAMFAILALAGDIGCSSGPALAGVVSDSTGDLKTGLFTAAAFPVILVIGMLFLSRKGKSK